MEPNPNHLYGLVDMGSNGIRFSVTDLSPSTARSLPTVFQERLGTSLYDAQYSTGSKGPIPQDVINDVLASLRRFKAVCADFQVSETNIRVLATEATRNAVNSQDYRRQIKDVTGWEVDMLPKEAEGRIGALGVASSFETVDGLVMDLGGGSTQITWMMSKEGDVQTSPKGSFSFPYGAAALTQQLSTLKTEQARTDLKTKMRAEFSSAFANLDLPEYLQQKARDRGLTLYLSGGGFRGWGYLLMATHKIKPYTIPIINGFSVPVKDFADTDTLQNLASEQKDIFRVSKRRAAQVPAVAFLIGVLLEALPYINDVRFCQGGVREGFLFDILSPSIKSLSPLSSATSRYPICTDSAAHISSLLVSSLPGQNVLDRSTPPSLTPSVLRAIADTMYVQSSSIKESASTASLYLPITGVLSSAHGISHTSRAILALTLCQRWGSELPPPHDNLQSRLQSMLSQQEVWWCNYLGAIAALIGFIYPSGRIPGVPTANSEAESKNDKQPRITLQAQWTEGLGKKGNRQGVTVTVKLLKADHDLMQGDMLKDALKNIESVGKKKNRVGGKEYGFGVPVQVDKEWV